MRLPLLFLPLALLACNGGSDPDNDNGENGELGFDDFINVTQEATGDFACHAGDGDWLTQEVDADLVQVGAISGYVEDFESGDRVPDATLGLWYDNVVQGAPDAQTVSDANGAVTLDAPTCQGLSYRVNTDPELDETRVTLKAHHIFAPGASNEEFLSVSNVTYQVIPGLLGISVDPTMGIVAGTAFDCDEEPVEFAQVIVVDEDGNIPQSQDVRYFVDRFPNREQPHTSDDGLWVAINIPEGTWYVEMWTVRGGELVMSGRTRLQVWPETINISNIFSGYGEGVKYPEACEEVAAG